MIYFNFTFLYIKTDFLNKYLFDLTLDFTYGITFYNLIMIHLNY